MKRNAHIFIWEQSAFNEMKPSRQKCPLTVKVGCSVARKTGPCPIVTNGQFRGNGRGLFKKKKNWERWPLTLLQSQTSSLPLLHTKVLLYSLSFFKTAFCKVGTGTDYHNTIETCFFPPPPQTPGSLLRPRRPPAPSWPPALLSCLHRGVCVSLLSPLWVLEIVPSCTLSSVAG